MVLSSSVYFRDLSSCNLCIVTLSLGHMIWNSPKTLQENSEEFAKAEVHDTGKPIWEARYDIEGCADAIEFYGGLAPAVAG